MAAVKKFRAACKERVAACTTAWDFPTGMLAARAHMDLVLVGDSTAVVSQGLDSTASMTLDEMIYHCKSVKRSFRTQEDVPFLLGDLPLGTYEISTEQAIQSSLRLVKEAGVDGVKLEGGREMVNQVAAITRAGIAVIGHIGLTPQRALATLDQDIGSITSSGETKYSFGSTAESARMVLEDAIALQGAGAVALVLEAVAPDAAQMITDTVKIPTIGIGSGPATSAQIAVQPELLGYLGCFLQKWHKQYADIGKDSVAALQKYREEVQGKSFPSTENSYEMRSGELAKLQEVKVQIQALRDLSSPTGSTGLTFR